MYTPSTIQKKKIEKPTFLQTGLNNYMLFVCKYLSLLFILYIYITYLESVLKIPVSPKSLELLHTKHLSPCVFINTQKFPRVHELTTHTAVLPPNKYQFL